MNSIIPKQEIENYRQELQNLLNELNRIQTEILDAVENIPGTIYIKTDSDWELKTTQFKFGTGYIYKTILSFKGKRIPESVDDLGNHYYAYGDFNNYQEFLDTVDLEPAVETIHEIVQKISEFLNEKTNTFKTKAEQLKTISLS